MIDTIALWHSRADEDLQIAQHEMQFDSPATSMICFHAQQVVEKYMKSFLQYHGVTPNRTHNLYLLINECIQLEPAFTEMKNKAIGELTTYAVVIRYIDDFHNPSIDEARESITKAVWVRSFSTPVFMGVVPLLSKS